MKNEEQKKEHTGYEYLGPQSEVAEAHNLPELPRRSLKANPFPVEGESKEPITDFGSIDLHFSWPDLKPHELDPSDDEWAGKDYKKPGSNA
jgi:hypothetical protein